MCKVGKLDRWLRYSGYYDKHLEFLVIISPSNNSDRAIIQQREVLEYSEKNRIVKIRFDVNNDFFKANAKIVGNEVYRTLLLDKNNKIVMVGDPMSNESINKLFIKVVANMLDHGGVYVPEY